MPSGGAGLYYFHIYFLVTEGEYGHFAIMLNGSTNTCYADDNEGNPTCGVVLNLQEGTVVT